MRPVHMESDHDGVCLLFAVAAILKSNMAAKWLKIRNAACYHWIPYSPSIHLYTRIKSIPLLNPKVITIVEFKWQPF